MSKLMATIIKPTQIDIPSLVSTAAGNLIQARSDGLYAALAAAPNLQNQYVSSSTGNDANEGTRAAPLKTLIEAINRLPENTTGTVWLLEGDVFPIRQGNMPTTWGGTITNFGTPVGTGRKGLTIRPYGPQTDSYFGKDVNAANFYSWLIPSLNRPILEFGHYMYNGRAVGSVLIAGDSGGGSCNIWGCELRWTAAARSTATSTGIPWASAGYSWILDLHNGSIMGCVLPAPILSSQGDTLNYTTRLIGTGQFWNSTVPAGTTPWAVLGAVSKITFLDSGTMTDNTGATYAPLANTSQTNFGARLGGVIRDSNGTPRNILSNAVV